MYFIKKESFDYFVFIVNVMCMNVCGNNIFTENNWLICVINFIKATGYATKHLVLCLTINVNAK